MQTINIKKKPGPALIFLLTILGCSALVFYYFFLENPSPPETPAPQTVRGIPVSSILVTPKTYPARVTVFGQALPLWKTTIRSQVSGKIDQISPKLRKGKIVESNTLLVTINDTLYQAKLARAKEVMARAALDLLKELQERDQAKLNWEASGLKGQPGSPLVLRDPQMNAAQKALDTARADRKSAVEDLGYCRIIAPFKGVIVDRLVSPGDTVSAGDKIAVITGTDHMEIALGLDDTQLKLLGPNLENARVQIINESTQAIYDTGQLRDSHTIDPATRLHKVYCLVDQPMALTPSLLSGTFLSISITTRLISGLLKIPESALTRQGFVWTIDKNNNLKAFKVSPLFYEGGQVFIHSPQGILSPLKIALSPNNAFVTGMSVQPQTQSKGSGE